MPKDEDLLIIPNNLIPFRDQLRVVGYELIRYSQSHAQREASRYRHKWEDYEFSVHRIESIKPEDGQIWINPHPFYIAEKDVPRWTQHYIMNNKPEGFGLLKTWFSNPVTALITLVVPPYGLTMLGLVALGDNKERKKQKELEKRLSSLSEMPKFLHGCTLRP